MPTLPSHLRRLDTGHVNVLTLTCKNVNSLRFLVALLLFFLRSVRLRSAAHRFAVVATNTGQLKTPCASAPSCATPSWLCSSASGGLSLAQCSVSSVGPRKKHCPTDSSWGFLSVGRSARQVHRCLTSCSRCDHSLSSLVLPLSAISLETNCMLSETILRMVAAFPGSHLTTASVSRNGSRSVCL